MTDTNFVDTINPATVASFSINGITLSNVAPTTNQIVQATSPTASNWQTGVVSLKTTSAPVNVSASAPPSGAGETLIATSATTATWQAEPIDTFTVATVRVATIANGTLASDFENGDTIDGITLSTGDRILIKDQTTPIENGVYIVNVSGAPTRATDFQAGTAVSGFYLFCREGTLNANLGFLCTNAPGSDIVNTDNLAFAIFDNAGSVLRVASVQALTGALSTNVKKIIIIPGTYLITSTITITGTDTHIEGLKNSTTILRATNPLASFILDISGASDILITNLELDGDESNVTSSQNLINIDTSSARIIFDQCRFRRVGATFAGLASTSCDRLTVQNCQFIDSVATSLGLSLTTSITNSFILYSLFESPMDSGISYSGNDRLIVAGCVFNGAIGSAINTSSSTDELLINSCIFEGSTTGIEASGNSTLLIKSCFFNNIAGTGTSQAGIYLNSARAILDSNTFINSAEDSIIIGSASANDVIMINNTITNAGGYGLTISNTNSISRHTIEQNQFSSNQSGNYNISLITTSTRDYIKQNLAQLTRTSAITGTVVDTTTSSAQLIGTGTNFLSTIKPGDVITIPVAGTRTVQTVDSNTQLTMTATYSATTTQNITSLDLDFLLSGYDTTYLLTSSANVNSTSASLPNLRRTSGNQTIYIELDVFATSVVLTPTTTNTDLTAGGGWTTVTFNGAGDNAVLRWSGNGWDVVDSSGGTVIA